MRRTLVGTAAFLLASAALAAADFWAEKDFTAWSAQQVEKLLTDSPWAKKATIVTGSLREQPLSDGGIEAGGAGLGGGGGTARASDGGGGFQGVRRITVTVAWLSALPIRQAVARRRIGLETPIPPEEQRRLAEDEPFYVVAVAGLPMRVVKTGTIDEVRDKTALKPARKEPIKLDNIRVFSDGNQSVRVEFVFPKSNAIVLEDKDVEFVTRMGDAEITKKFRLPDMVVRGRLAL